MKSKIDIRSIRGDILFSHKQEDNTIKRTIEAFLTKNAGKDIIRADLSGLNLSGVIFSNIKFYDSRFDNSNFKNCRFNNCSFYGCSLCNCIFTNSVFSGCTFYDDLLYNSTFYNSKFNTHRFFMSPFESCYFDKKTEFSDDTIKKIRTMGQLCIFDQFKHDLWIKMLVYKDKIPALRNKLVSGTIETGIYKGMHINFARTIAGILKCDVYDLDFRVDDQSPVENWFVMIKKGDTPGNSEIVKLTVEWINDFLIHMRS